MNDRRGVSSNYGFGLKQQSLFTHFCLLITIFAGLIVVIFRSSIVPARFMSDERTIQGLAQGLWSSGEDGSFTQVSTIYRVLGMADNEMLAGILGFSLACIPYLMVLAKYRNRGSSLLATAICVIGILLSAVYLGSYSKEAFIVPIIMAFITLRHSKVSTIILCLLITVYAYNFRTYWFLVLLFFVAVTFVVRRVSSAVHLFAVGLVLVLVGSILFGLVVGVPADYFRMSVNTQRSAIGDVNTLIPRFVEFWGPLDGPINNTLSAIFLQFPIPLFLKLAPYYIVLFVILSALWISFYRSAGKIKAVEDDALKASLLRIVIFTMSFTITQAFFEPDYGSALKHLTPFFPLFVMLYLGTRVDPIRVSGLKGLSANEVKI